MDKKYSLLVICILILLACFVGTVCAKTWYVDDDGGADFMRIQDAVDNATAGDTIIVSDGTYVENVDVYVDNLTISSGNGSDFTIVQAVNSSDHVFEVSADYVNISGFTVKGAIGLSQAGIYLNNTDYCTISSNKCLINGKGISLTGSNDNIISGNYVNNNGNGIYLYSSGNNTITGNNVSNNYGGGICLWVNSNNNTISGNTVYNNSVSGIYSGIYLGYSSDNTISGNTVCNNSGRGISLESAMVKPVGGDLCWWYSSGNTISRNDVNNNGKGISLLYSYYNSIHFNNFINNTENAYSYFDSTNIWNSTEQIAYRYNGSTFTNQLGNYWSDYEERYPDAEELDSTGIWNIPYEIDGDSDKYPLMEPFKNYIRE